MTAEEPTTTTGEKSSTYDERDHRTADRLARRHLADDLAPPRMNGEGQLARLTDACEALTTQIEAGETPDLQQLDELRFRAHRLLERADDLALLYELETDALQHSEVNKSDPVTDPARK
jgi:hypothetical protein